MTLVEMMVTMVIGALVVMGVFQLFRSTNKSYYLQDRMIEMNLNAQYTLERLTETLGEAGATLPTEGLAVVTARPSADSASDSVVVLVNLLESNTSVRLAAAASGAAAKIPVLDHTTFLGLIGTGYVAIERAAGAVDTVALVGIDSSVDTNPRLNVTRLPNAVTPGMKVYGFEVQRYFRSGNNLCLNSANNSLAENIARLELNYTNEAGAQARTQPWTALRFANIKVRAVSEDGKKSKTLTSFVRLRNRG